MRRWFSTARSESYENEPIHGAQIVKILREVDICSVAVVAKPHAVSEQTIYAWLKRYGALEVSDVRPHSGPSNFTPREFINQSTRELERAVF